MLKQVKEKKTGKADVALNLIGKLYGIEANLKGKAAEEKIEIGKKNPNSSLISFMAGLSTIKIKYHRRQNWGKR